MFSVYFAMWSEGGRQQSSFYCSLLFGALNVSGDIHM